MDSDFNEDAMLDDGALLEDQDLEIDDEEDEEEPTLTFLVAHGRIMSKCDEMTAMVQAVDKILQTERFVYPIYDDQYGNDLPELIGESMTYANAEVERMIIEAITEDDRVTGVEISEINQKSKDVLEVKGTCYTVYGTVNIDTEVDIGSDTE